MSDFVVRGLSPEVTTHVRSVLRAPQYGHPAHREVATGTGPCRECLCTFAVGEEERLLFTYSPHGASTRLAQPGPVFIHAAQCAPHAGEGYPDGLTVLPVVAECHFGDGSISRPDALRRGEEASVLTQLLARPNVEFIHLRHGEAGCFIARVDRIGGV